jgi:hypothetical protein
MNAKTIGVLLMSLTFLIAPVTTAQMMGEGMMKGQGMMQKGLPK